ncbi:hypothetical protein ABB37_04676 [Leptomonas pyrrhocoris]|uniref:Uncharacterized protein n=1 Tax=Leptomonas pyrrhocoris TaxID=157538 RepID=A0A0N0DVJ5_LEPPY|nr:hypothetical protein ABB37_04676 [Leptomonas pyrrhocoris]KPA80448.1 hypothetical protein ABB37_04676 [Leptomonas pyrrhocoris]|eukprot:XP_015658887.1 hypothetical protein ABB37_04676 [Leptomonas pyrrhocoris]
MPSIEVDVASVPDIIEAQLTLSYSRLTDLIRVIVDQGNGHEDDIDEIRARLAKLVQENNKLRSEIETLKQNQGPSSDLAAALEEVKNTVRQLGDKVDANATQIAAGAAAQTALAESVEKQAAERQAKMQASVAEHAADVNRRLVATEKSVQVSQAFTDLWGVVPEQLLEMGRRNANQEVEHSLKDRTTYLLSMAAFVKVHEEMDVLRALQQRQAADALAAKTSEVARASRTASLVGPPPPQESKDNSAEVEELTKSVRALELQMQMFEKQRLLPLESTLNELQSRGNANERVGNTEKDVNRLYDQLGSLEDRLNLLLGLSSEKTNATADGDAVNPALVDLAHRISVLEGTVEGLPRGATPLQLPGNTPASAEAAANGAGGEVVSADGGARPSSSHSPHGRPPSGRPGSGLLPNLSKDPLNSSSTAAKTASPTPQRTSSLRQRPQSASKELAQPTVEVLRREEVVQPAVASGRRRISVAVEPDDGLRRRVSQLEENAAILEVNKADRKELQKLEDALQQALTSMNRQHSAAPQSSPSLIPQRPMSAGGRFVQNHANSSQMEYAQAQRGDGFNRLASSSGTLGRPMFVGSSSSVYLHDGARLTNATVSYLGENRT